MRWVLPDGTGHFERQRFTAIPEDAALSNELNVKDRPDPAARGGTRRTPFWAWVWKLVPHRSVSTVAAPWRPKDELTPPVGSIDDAKKWIVTEYQQTLVRLQCAETWSHLLVELQALRRLGIAATRVYALASFAEASKQLPDPLTLVGDIDQDHGRRVSTAVDK